MLAKGSRFISQRACVVATLFLSVRLSHALWMHVSVNMKRLMIPFSCKSIERLDSPPTLGAHRRDEPPVGLFHSDTKGGAPQAKSEGYRLPKQGELALYAFVAPP